MSNSLLEFVQNHARLVVLTGAGCSLKSGIPTYRNQEGIWQRSAPIAHHDFLGKHESRQRYWARSLAGWPTIAGAIPNIAHHHLAALERLDRIALLVTQNVDGLHQQAGHKNVIELHGSLSRVICLSCGSRCTRQSVQDRLQSLNPHIPSDIQLAPDGDADLVMDFTTISVPACMNCDGILKPDVVFFGGTVDKLIVQSVYEAISAADALLIVGTSLNVFSGYRFCKRAAELSKPIACINPGNTRGDGLFTLKIARDCGAVLDGLIQQI
jgi:NAD-dependent SIR2 family protein deacetylase